MPSGGADDAIGPYRRRQVTTWFALTSYCRAMVETEAPDAYEAATISRFKASGHRLLVRRSSLVPINTFVDTSTARAVPLHRSQSGNRHPFTRRSSPEGYLGRTAKARASTRNCATKSSRQNSSRRCTKRRCSSRDGVNIRIPDGRISRSAIDHRRLKRSCCQPLAQPALRPGSPRRWQRAAEL